MSELKCGDCGRSDEHCIADCLKTLKQKLDCAVKALGWYKDGYGVTTDDSYMVHVDENISYRRSGGKRARLALEEIKRG